MNKITHKFSIKNFIIQSIGLSVILLASNNSIAQNVNLNSDTSKCNFFEGYISNTTGTVIDPRNNLIWKICAEGYTWNGTKCEGKAQILNWYEAMKYAKNHNSEGKTDWRLPSLKEYLPILGNHENCKNNTDAQSAVSSQISHPIKHSNSNRSDAGAFWASTSLRSDKNSAQGVQFQTGAWGYNTKESRYPIRLVRGGQESSQKEFIAEYKDVNQYFQAIEARERHEAAERERQRAFENSPAGIAQRQGRQLCEAQKQTCFASCPAYNYDSSNNNTHFQCESRCGAISCY